VIESPDVQHIAESYRLATPLQIEAMSQEIYAIQSADGEFVLKVFAPDEPLDQHRYQHWLLLALEPLGLSFNLPYPLRDRQGATFHVAPSGEVWVLTRRYSGQGMFPNDPDQAYAVGAALAELHGALETIQPFTRPDAPDYNLNQRTLLHLRDALPSDPAQIGLHNTPEGKHRMKRFLILARQFQQPPPAPDQYLHWHIVHGDFFGANLLYDGERVTGVLDFKFVRPDYRVREFAETLLRVANDLGPLFWGTARAFVEGYAEKLYLTRPEIELVPRFMVEYLVDQVLFYAGKQPQRAATALRIQEDISAWQEIEQSRLLAMLRGVFLGE
jgi:homoserine kinase type II